MDQQQFNQIKAMVLSMLRHGEYQQALGMLQGACAIDRRFDDMRRQEWHDTQASLEASVRL